MHILKIPDSIVINLIYYLGLKDILALGDSHTKLRDLVYKSPEVWNDGNLLFPIGDKSITDKFIQRVIPRITRHYGILELRMIELPLTWSGYLMIFDQFAHSVNRIEIKTNLDELKKLVHHLTIFAGNLAILQQNNKIPITFRQYAFDDEEEYSLALADSNYLGQRTLHNLNDQFACMKLDDPPFERLHDFHIVTTACTNASNEVTTMRQLELLASFLSGRPISINTHHNIPGSPIPTTFYSNKRQRENDQPTSSKHSRHYSPKRQESHPLPSYSSFA
ncbi:hypothetical protein INT48_006520 [Thamnidium elegans]|uniref:F-box domain-containing protein n=1 Tax=Thamnidium elegans TaxID=101142 RepID=A0A8H7SQU1_9FUNG|nr:hypothetical protein INT48_006520 [Thamnidium elegans]